MKFSKSQELIIEILTENNLYSDNRFAICQKALNVFINNIIIQCQDKVIE